MQGISEVWDDLNSTDQANLLETIAGKNRSNEVAALLSNWSNVEAAIKAATEAEGSAAAENEKYVNSVQGRLDKLTTSLQSLANTFMSSNFLKGGISFITTMVEGVEGLIDTLGTIPTLITAISTIQSIRGQGFFKVIEDDAKASGLRITSIFNDIASVIKQTFSKKINFSTDFGQTFADDIEALNNYITKIRDGVPAEEAFAQTMREASVEAQNFAQTTNASTIEVAQFKKICVQSKITDMASSFKNARSLINEYNTGLQTCGLTQEEFLDAVGQSNSTFANYLKTVGQGNATFTGYIGQLVKTKIATIGLQAATMLLNAAMGLCIGAIVSFVVSGITKLINAESDLAEKVEEVTSQFEKQHEELSKLKGDYDTTNESSLISKYAKLSKGIGAYNKNISLTSDEYSEYLNIVDTLADQFPNLISGYDDQGNAILSCKNNVSKLVEEYEKLIHLQNQEILTTNNGDIEDNFENVLSQSEGYDWLEILGNSFSAVITLFGADAKNFDMKFSTADMLNDLMTAKTEVERRKILDEIESEILNSSTAQFEIMQALQGAGVDVSVYDNLSDVLEETLEKEPQKIQNILDTFYGQFDSAIAEYKTKATALLSEAFDVRSAISGLDYGYVTDELQDIAYQAVNSLDLDYLREMKKRGQSIEDWTTELLDQLNVIGREYGDEFENIFEVQSKFNTGEISYGEYINELREFDSLLDSLNLKSSAKNQIRINLGLDEGGVVDEYENLINRLTDSDNYDFDINESEARAFLDSLTAEEYAIAVEVIAEMSNNGVDETVDDILDAINQKLTEQGLTLDLTIEAETEKIESLASAISESLSGSGLTSESKTVIESMFGDLSSYNPSKLFESTANGIHLNSNELRKLNDEYNKTNLSKINKQMDGLGDIYNQTKEELYNLTYGTKEYNTKLAELDAIESQIKSLEQLSAEYEGLTSAYQQWQLAESAGNERDMYESIIEGWETVDDELSRGWLDDSTVEFIRLLKGDTATIIDGDGTEKEINIATASVKELRQVWKDLDKTIEHTTYSVDDFFTVDEDGNSTSKGVFNFLDAIGQMEEEKFGGKDVVKRDDNGNIIGFDFALVGGDKVIAEALGVSEELVQIMQRAAEDAGFVVTLDGSFEQLDVLREKAQAAAESMNKILKKDGKATIDINMNADSVEEIQSQFDELMKTFGEKNGDGKLTGAIDMSINGAEEAMTVASTLQSMLDKLSRPAYMEIEVSEVEDELRQPLENLQQLRTITETEHQFKLRGVDTSELEESRQEIYDYFEKLDPEVKAEIGLVDDDGNPLTGDALKKKLESEEVSIAATVDIQLEMDDKLGILVDKALLDAGIITDEEFRKRVEIYLDADVDNDDAKNKTENAVDDVVESSPEREKNIKIITETLGTEDVDDLTYKLQGLNDKQIEAIVEVLGQLDVDLLKNTMAKIKPKKVQAIAEAIGNGDVDALNDAIHQLSPKQVQAIAKAFGYNDVTELDKAIENMDGITVQAIAQALGLGDVNTLQITINNMQGNTVDAKVNTDGQAGKVDTLQDKIDSLTGKIVDVVVNIVKTVSEGGKKKAAQRTGADPDGKGTVNGTANVDGTTGKAFKQGNWGTKNSGTALVGELGRETLIRGSRYYTVGDEGAEFIKYKRGDIILNHKQTEQLFSNGKVTADGGRAKALSNGTAFVNGTAFISGSGADGYFGSVKDGEKSSSSSDSTKNEFEDTIDWIEVILDRAERAIDKYEKQADNVYKSWSERNKALENEIDEVRNTISLYEKARNSYLSEANSIGLSEYYAKKVREGSFDIEDFAGEGDEELVEKIEKYQDLYEKYLDCIDAIDELEETESELFEKKFNNVIDRYESVLDDIERAKNLIEEYMSQYEGTVLSDYVAHDAKSYQQIANYYQELIRQEQLSIIELEKKKAELIAKLQEAVDNGLSTNSEAYAEMLAKINDIDLEIAQANSNIIDSNNNVIQSYLDGFDTIAENYENMLSTIEFERNMLEEKIAQSEAKGWLISEEYYNALIDNEHDVVSKLEEEKSALYEQLQVAMENGLEKYSNKWYELVNQINDVTLAIEESNTALLEYENTIRELKWEQFELLQDRISDVTKESEFLIELMSHKDLYDDNGNLTNEGKATMGLYGLNYNVNMHQADLYADKVTELNQQIAENPYNQDLINKRNEYLELQRECILAAEDEKEAIKDLIEESIELELDSLSELIDKYQDALESQKDLYDYQRKVKEQTSEIAKLEKEQAAYANDTSEEARQKQQKIAVALEEAREDLQETEVERLIENTQKITDALFDQYSELLNERLDNVDALISDAIAEINADASLIGTTLTETANEVGYNLSTEMDEIWNSSTASINGVITQYGEEFSSAQTSTNFVLGNIKANLDSMISQLSSIAANQVAEAKASSAFNSTQANTTSKTSSGTSSSAASTVSKTTVTPTTTTSNTTSKTGTGNGTPEIGDQVTFLSGQYYYSSDGSKPLGSKYQGKKVYITNINTRSWATHPYHISTGKTLGSGDLGWLKKNQISGYATGKKKLSEDEVAWTQEEGQEFIVRPSDGAILTPVAKNDSILNAQASSNIWKMANAPAEFIKENLNLGDTSVPNNSNVQNNFTQNLENVTFSLPNVRNYDELVTQMQNDPNFKRLIEAMSIGKLAGKSSLAVGKAIR